MDNKDKQRNPERLKPWPVHLDHQLNAPPEAALQVVYDSVIKLWDVVDNLTQLRPKQSGYYNVSIFGSSRIQPETLEYDMVRTLANKLAIMGCRIITGGGPGLMQAANEGAAEAAVEDPEASVGLSIQLPFEQGANAFVGQVYEHRTFFSRLHHFVLRSNAFVVTPGGIGTALEAFMIWQLLQVHHLYGTPLVMIGEMWPELIDWSERHMVRHNPMLADELDIAIPQCVKTTEEAIAIIRADHAEWRAAQMEP